MYITNKFIKSDKILIKVASICNVVIGHGYIFKQGKFYFGRIEMLLKVCRNNGLPITTMTT